MIEPSLQPSRTAAKEDSIWRDLSEDTFRKNILELGKASEQVPCDSKAYVVGDWQDQQDSYGDSNGRILPVAAEQRLADDLALIAVPAKFARTVSAVAVEESHDHQGLTVRVAANQGVANESRDAFSQVFELLASCACKSLPSRLLMS